MNMDSSLSLGWGRGHCLLIVFSFLLFHTKGEGGGGGHSQGISPYVQFCTKEEEGVGALDTGV